MTRTYAQSDDQGQLRRSDPVAKRATDPRMAAGERLTRPQDAPLTESDNRTPIDLIDLAIRRDRSCVYTCAL